MQIIKSFIRLAIFLCPAFSTAQSTYFMQGSKDQDFIDRMEIKLQDNRNLNFSTLKPYNRKAIVREMELLDSLQMVPTDSALGFNRYGDRSDLVLNKVDQYNMNSLLMNNSEWLTNQKLEYESVNPLFGNFYKTKANLLEVNDKDFFLVINPLLNLQFGGSSGGTGTSYFNSRGVSVRGMIAKRIGFSSFITDNQEKGPDFFQGRADSFHAVPGVGFYKPFKKNGFDYFDARGYITFNAAKYIDFQFGYDKNFIGNGYRSLFLSDYGNSYLFLKINTRIWKLNYQNLFMELMPQFIKTGDTLLDRKYAAMHHLSINVTKWLNIGLFEGIIFGRKNHFDLQYLNPVIFLRHVEGTVGSPDNAVAGFDFKANIAHAAQFYGQFLLDEFVLSQITKNTGYWANKYGIQLGFKYVDAFAINNLDVQLEFNRVRPFTYAHYDYVGNYTHYNQPLAHPLGANFNEIIAIAKYQPFPKWYANGRIIYYTQGLDSSGQNFGSNPFELFTSRSRDYGYKVGSGDKAKCVNLNFQLSYELKQNLFLDGTLMYRSFKTENRASINTGMALVGIRWNMFRREYDY